MSGPIVRTGTNPKFWTNWDKIFGDKSAAGKDAKSGAAAKKSETGKTAASRPAAARAAARTKKSTKKK